MRVFNRESQKVLSVSVHYSISLCQGAAFGGRVSFIPSKGRREGRKERRERGRIEKGEEGWKEGRKEVGEDGWKEGSKEG
jgi:hypothetical protein